MSKRELRAAAALADDDHKIVQRVLEELARKRISRATLAADARLSLSTVEKILSGRRTITLATLVRLEEALGISLRDGATPRAPEAAAGSAPDTLGGYGRKAVTWLEGRYVTLRPSFSGQGAVYAYRMDIAWDDTRSVLTFREAEREDPDFAQFGDIAVPHQSGYIYLVTNRHGQHRMVVLARPTITGEMHGILTTLQAGRGAQLSPVSMPIVLSPLAKNPSPHYGRIAAGHPAHRGYSALLRRTIQDGFAQFVTE